MKRKKSRIASLFGRIFKLREWLDFERIRGFFLYFFEGAKQLVPPEKNTKEAEFSDVVKKMGLREEALEKQGRALLWWSRLLFIVALGIFGVAIYHGSVGHVIACIWSLLLMLIALTLSFRYHFLSFQIKERKLGVSLSDWFRRGFWGGRT